MPLFKWQALFAICGLAAVAASLSAAGWGTPLMSLLAALLGLGLIGIAMLGAMMSPRSSPAELLVIASWSVALLLLGGAGVVAVAVMQSVYTGQSPYLIVALSVLSVPLAMIVLAALAPRSDAAYFGCCALLAVVLSIAVYAIYGIGEMLVDLPEIRAEHFMRPARRHVFNVVVAGLIALIGFVTLVGLLRVAYIELVALPERAQMRRE